MLKACKAAGVNVQFLGNVWGMDENAAKAAGDAADGVVFPLRTAVTWGGNAPGMKTVVEISEMSDPAGKAYRAVHYIAGVCTALYMKEAIDWAAKNGGATGENVAKGFHQRKDWVPAGMEGVCKASTWTEKDHRGTLKVDLYRMKVAARPTAISTISWARAPSSSRRSRRSSCRASRNGWAGERCLRPPHGDHIHAYDGHSVRLELQLSQASRRRVTTAR